MPARRSAPRLSAASSFVSAASSFVAEIRRSARPLTCMASRLTARRRWRAWSPSREVRSMLASSSASARGPHSARATTSLWTSTAASLAAAASACTAARCSSTWLGHTSRAGIIGIGLDATTEGAIAVGPGGTRRGDARCGGGACAALLAVAGVGCVMPRASCCHASCGSCCQVAAPAAASGAAAARNSRRRSCTSRACATSCSCSISERGGGLGESASCCSSCAASSAWRRRRSAFSSCSARNKEACCRLSSSSLRSWASSASR